MDVDTYLDLHATFQADMIVMDREVENVSLSLSDTGYAVVINARLCH